MSDFNLVSTTDRIKKKQVGSLFGGGKSYYETYFQPINGHRGWEHDSRAHLQEHAVSSRQYSDNIKIAKRFSEVCAVRSRKVLVQRSFHELCMAIET